jgi:hypothetical protein
MSSRARIVTFATVAAVLTAGTASWVAVEVARAAARADAPPMVAVAPEGSLDGVPRIVFRNVEIGSRYGLVSMVRLDDPDGPREFTDVACDRVYATAAVMSCLRTRRGVATTFEASQLDANGDTVDRWGLPGLPSRTRLSPDGRLLATTSFVTGHSYMQAGFSTATEIHEVGGRDLGNLESFALVVGGRTVEPVDRNVWGVTFAADDDTFYATVATGATTYLARGSLSGRTLTTLRRGVECPSLSPDGTRIAFKSNVGGTTPHWQIAVLDLASDTVTTLAGETHSVDDQVEWLDDSLLYGLPRAGEAGVSDIWQIAATPTAKPHLLIEHAWSPSVVRS